MPKTLYSIRDWDKNFEVAQSRRDRSDRWVALPTKHDGKSYRRLMRRPNGIAIYGAWVLIVQVASKCPVKGVLADGDGPLDAQDLEDKTDCPAEVFEQAFLALTDPKIGWLNSEQIENNSECAQSKSAFAMSTEQTEQNRQTSVVVDPESIPDQSSTSLAVETARRVYGALKRKVKPKRGDDAILRKAAAAVAASKIPESWAIDAAEGVAIKAPGNPGGYFRNTLKATCEANGVDFGAVSDRRIDPAWFGTGPPENGERREHGRIGILTKADTNGIGHEN